MAKLERRRSAKDRYDSFNFQVPTRLDLQFWGWGRNDSGQLGFEGDANQLKPAHLESLEGKDLVHLAGNSAFNMAALTDDGEVFMTGVNDTGQLGSKSAPTRHIPSRVAALEIHRITHIALGDSHALSITEQGFILAWGNNEHGQLGYTTQGVYSPTPKRANVQQDLHFVRVAAGSHHSLALSSNGRVFACGNGEFGSLGLGNTGSASTFTNVVGLNGFGITQIDCGEYHNAALSLEGKVWTWGRGRYGQLGLGDRETRLEPYPVLSLKYVKIKHISCGDSHTLCCGDRGKVFCWGQSRWGQTGTGCTEDVLEPVQIEQLKEEYIIQVACGSRHSVALARRGTVFVFGNGELGQMADGNLAEISPIPKPVSGMPSYPVVCALAGGDHTIVMLRKPSGNPLMDLSLDKGRYGQGMMPFKVMDLFILLDEVEKSSGHQSLSEKKESFFRAMEDMFSCPGFLLQPFGTVEGGKRGLNLELIKRTYERIFRSYDERLLTVIGHSCTSSLAMMLQFVSGKERKNGQQLEDRLYDWMRALIIYMLNPLFGEDRASGGVMVHQIASLLEHLTAKSTKVTYLSILQLLQNSSQCLERFILELPVEVFGGRLINGVHKHLNNLTRHHTNLENPVRDEKREEVLKCGELLGLFYKVNQGAGEPVGFEKFANCCVSEAFELGKEYLEWSRILSHPEEPIEGIQSLCQIPFILTSEAKSKIIQGEAVIIKSFAVQESQLNAFFSGRNPGSATFLEIKIRRDNLRQDAVDQLMHREKELRMPLKVKFFSNGVQEEGQDEGGLSKEFFQLLIEEIFNVDFGMFVYNEETRDFWFSHQALEADDFRLVGLVLGLAIYNGIILDVHFPLVVYKKLKGLRTAFSDLKKTFPELGKGLQQLLDFEGDVENTFCRTFEVEYEYFGEMMTAELKQGGSSINVTAENRKEYVELYTKYILDESIANQFKAFKDGFYQVCAGHALQLYRYEELELLICGLPHLDFKELERVARYEGGYSGDHKTIKDFWSVIHSLSLTDKKKFLFFVTGCDRAPVGGLAKLTVLIQRSGPDTDRLPTSHTCFNILLLPEYSSKEKMADRLMLAIQNAQGFGLQ